MSVTFDEAIELIKDGINRGYDMEIRKGKDGYKVLSVKKQLYRKDRQPRQPKPETV